MAKTKIIAAGAALVVLIIIAGFSMMSIVQSKTVADIEKSSVTETAESSVSLKWKKVPAADGYYVYCSEADKDDFEKIATVEGGNKKTFTVEKLEQATQYDFYVTAYKKSKDNVESKDYQVISACTTPKKQVLTGVESTDAGVMTVAWEINPKALGYELQYIEGDGSSFEDAQTITVGDKAVGDYKINKLPAEKTYAARVRSFIQYNEATLYGPWSKAGKVKIAQKIEAPSNIDKNKPMIALTFDDGPGYNKSSEKILKVLEKYNARATFFMVGQNAKDHPDNLKRKVKLKCELANHTWDHNHYGDNVTSADIKKASNAIKKASGGRAPTAFRSPGGNTTDAIRKECKAEGLPLYYWSLDTQDWKSRNADAVYNAVMNNVQDGDIILMHEIYDSTAEAVARMVPELIKQGYQLVTCQELILAKTGKMPEAGVQYMNATTVKNETS